MSREVLQMALDDVDAKSPDAREHITDDSPCWCFPEVVYRDPQTGVAVIVHRNPQ